MYDSEELSTTCKFGDFIVQAFLVDSSEYACGNTGPCFSLTPGHMHVFLSQLHFWATC